METGEPGWAHMVFGRILPSSGCRQENRSQLKDLQKILAIQIIIRTFDLIYVHWVCFFIRERIVVSLLNMVMRPSESCLAKQTAQCRGNDCFKFLESVVTV